MAFWDGLGVVGVEVEVLLKVVEMGDVEGGFEMNSFAGRGDGLEGADGEESGVGGAGGLFEPVPGRSGDGADVFRSGGQQIENDERKVAVAD